MRHNGAMAIGPQESVLAPRFTRAMSVLVVGICLITEFSLFAWGHTDVLLRSTPAVALVAFATYAVFWAPLIRVNPQHIEILNPLRTSVIPWSAVADVSTGWSLAIVTDTQRFSAWAAPAQSPWESVGRLHRDALGRPSLRPEAPGQRGSVSGLAPIIVRQWESHRQGDAGGKTVSTHWNVPTIVVLATLTLFAVVGSIWP
jgi:hypothetical protein